MEELFKFLAIIITIVILKNKINIVLLIRTPLMFTHMTLNMIMGEFIGRAKYNKQKGEGQTVLYWVLALIIPMALHTLYDAGIVFNYPPIRGSSFLRLSKNDVFVRENDI